jgi:hypothetical protein
MLITYLASRSHASLEAHPIPCRYARTLPFGQQRHSTLAKDSLSGCSLVEFASAIPADVVDSGRSLAKFGGKSHRRIGMLQ